MFERLTRYAGMLSFVLDLIDLKIEDLKIEDLKIEDLKIED